jgi:hypothetical protein
VTSWLDQIVVVGPVRPPRGFRILNESSSLPSSATLCLILLLIHLTSSAKAAQPCYRVSYFIPSGPPRSAPPMPSNPELSAVPVSAAKRKNAPKEDEDDSGSDSGSDVVSMQNTLWRRMC